MTDEEIAKKFSSQLKRWRFAANMTQHDLSILCGVSAQSISAIENGDAMARRSTMAVIIANGFEMSPKRFFTEEPRATRRRERVSGMPVPNLRMWRVVAKLSTNQLADRVRVSLTTIHHLENGGHASPALAHRIARYFGKTLEEMDMEAPTVNLQKDDMAADYLGGQSIEDFAEMLEEEFVRPKRQAAAQKKLDTTMVEQGIIKPAKPKPRADAPLSEADVMVSSQADILAALQADAQEARARRLEEEVEEE